MSHYQNQKHSFWQDVLDALRRIPCIRGDRRVSKRDDSTVSQAILLNAMILKDIGSSAGYRSDANIKRWCILTKKLDVRILDQLMKESIDVLRRTSADSYESFKRSLSVDSNTAGAFLAPVRDYLESYTARPNAKDFRVLNQFLGFMTRICLMDENFVDEAIEAYLETERRISSHEYDEENMDSIREVVQEWFSGFRIGALAPAHGPGATAFLGRASQYEKYEDIKFDTRLLYLTKGEDLSEHVPRVVHGETRTAQVTFVPKNLSSMRTICMEPTGLMYYQQALWFQIDEFLSNHPVLSHHIRLKDQGFNRELSRIGSLTGRYATIDLSAASDSLTWKLMKHVFKGTDYYKGALLTRSELVELPNGDRIVPAKFAPMGSTFCFPTQCIIFAAICEVVSRKNGVRSATSYAVYGDDIIIRESLAEEVVEFLHSLGFLVNESKSFLSGRFKESCGGEYFDGFDVTPLKIPRGYVGTQVTSRTPSLFTLLIDFINECGKRGFKTARTYLISRFNNLPVSLRPFFDDGTRGIASPQATNFHLRKRQSRSLQIARVEAGEVSSPTPRNRVDDQTSLFMWHYRAARRYTSKYAFTVPEDNIVVRTAPEKSVLRSTLIFDPRGSEEMAYQEALRILSMRP